MGIINVTPDSFSDGGLFLDPESATAHGLQLIRDGADMLDIGGESTRPGAQRTSASDELQRAIPVIKALSACGAPLSVDTTRASVASAGVAAGASMINDVSGGLSDPEMFEVVAASGAAYVLSHWRAPSLHMDRHASYESVVDEVIDELRNRIDAAGRAGVEARQVIIDPGLGFAKTNDDCWALLADLEKLTSLGFPVLIGASRKRFLAECSDFGGVSGSAAADREEAAAAIAALAAAQGAWGVRVHVPRAAAAAVRVASRLNRHHQPRAGVSVEPAEDATNRL